MSSDLWIPNSEKKRITTPSLPGLKGIKVSNVLITEGKQWDYDLIRDIFNESDVKRILSIPLSQTSNEDSWI